MSRAEVRDATSFDLKGMLRLIENLVQYEEGLGNDQVVDGPVRGDALLTMLARALVNPDFKLLVIEKSGRLIALYILEVEVRSPLFRQPTVCNVWVGYSKKSPIFIKKLLGIAEEWAKSRGCNALKVSIYPKNDRVRKLLEILGFQNTQIVYEKEVAQ